MFELKQAKGILANWEASAKKKDLLNDERWKIVKRALESYIKSLELFITYVKDAD